MGAGTAKYWAFISYSHRDATAAARLQKELETYRLPRRLEGRQTAVGPVPAFLKPIFRDREELQAGADLGATVREALAASRYLVVVCSPDAARSEWVEREIVEFKKLHGEDRVLAFIVAGEPFASRIAGREAEECFPRSLRFALAADGEPGGEPREPIAADLRPQGDGRRLSLLKLVAGMAGVGVDELVRRDAQRRIRRMAIVTTASLAALAITVILAIVAYQARGEAERQREQAEGLLEFMLGDLRRKLEPVGRLDALDAVGEKAIGYYAAQEASRLDANSLGHRSRALHLLGEIRDQRGQLDEALVAFQSAAKTTGELLARAPGDGQRIFDHGQSVYWVGYVAWRRGQAEVAEKSFLEYRDLARKLARIDPGKVDWVVETAYANQNLGVVQLDGNRLAEALASFTETRDVLAALVPKKPALAFELSDAQGWIAKVREASGDYRGAIEAQQARLEIFGKLPDAGKDARLRRHAANATFELARLRLNLGDAAGARVDALKAIEIADALVAADPSNLFWLSESCFNRLRLAEVALAQGRTSEARQVLDRVGRDAATLVAKDASKLVWQVNLKGHLLLLRTRVDVAEGRRANGPELETFLEGIGKREASGTKLSRTQVELAAAMEMAAGDARAAEGRREAARELWQAAASRIEPRAKGGDPPSMTLLARTALRLDDAARARDLAARTESTQYRHPSHAALQRELARAGGTGRAVTTTGS